jgi:hypothetical protein
MTSISLLGQRTAFPNPVPSRMPKSSLKYLKYHTVANDFIAWYAIPKLRPDRIRFRWDRSCRTKPVEEPSAF